MPENHLIHMKYLSFKHRLVARPRCFCPSSLPNLRSLEEIKTEKNEGGTSDKKDRFSQVQATCNILLTWLLSDCCKSSLQDGGHEEEDGAHAEHDCDGKCIDLKEDGNSRDYMLAIFPYF